MIEVEGIPEESLKKALAEGEFGEELRRSAPYTAIVLTQSWCPQWTMLQRGFERLKRKGEPREPLKVWTLEYDRHSDFERIRRFKEEEFGNREIPYVRYYRDGEFIGDSNFVSERKLLERFRAAGP
jgi:hypothetical protein